MAETIILLSVLAVAGPVNLIEGMDIQLALDGMIMHQIISG
jgi:hypothetical protein